MQQRLVQDYGLAQVEHVRPLLREVARPLRPRGFLFSLRGLKALDESQPFWRPYDLWNEALVETVFNQQQAGRSVYLDIEPEVLHEAAEEIWPPIRTSDAELENGFRLTVRRTCVGRHVNPQLGHFKDEDEGFGFEAHADRVAVWHDDRHAEGLSADEPPPSIALLALCSLAAERMRSDDGKAASNYYGRLAEVLELPEDRVLQLGDKYREHALPFWESLNVWLRDLHGQRGLPTAVSYGHRRFVSLPISQALIRAQERDRLSEFFLVLPIQSWSAGGQTRHASDAWPLDSQLGRVGSPRCMGSWARNATPDRRRCLHGT